MEIDEGSGFALIEEVRKYFGGNEVELACRAISRIKLKDVMNSLSNLRNAQKAALVMCKGDLHTLDQLVDAARVDFRDLIYAVTMKSE